MGISNIANALFDLSKGRRTNRHLKIVVCATIIFGFHVTFLFPFVILFGQFDPIRFLVFLLLRLVSKISIFISFLLLSNVGFVVAIFIQTFFLFTIF